jgi:hypothetical protein
MRLEAIHSVPLKFVWYAGEPRRALTVFDGYFQYIPSFYIGAEDNACYLPRSTPDSDFPPLTLRHIGKKLS